MRKLLTGEKAEIAQRLYETTREVNETIVEWRKARMANNQNPTPFSIREEFQLYHSQFHELLKEVGYEV